MDRGECLFFYVMNIFYTGINELIYLAETSFAINLYIYRYRKTSRCRWPKLVRTTFYLGRRHRSRRGHAVKKAIGTAKPLAQES
jgi:hypothetical protein